MVPSVRAMTIEGWQLDYYEGGSNDEVTLRGRGRSRSLAEIGDRTRRSSCTTAVYGGALTLQTGYTQLSLSQPSGVRFDVNGIK
jgi:hypothetical protein